MKTFKEFLEESKIKKLAKEIEKRVAKDLKKQRKKNPDQPTIANYGDYPVGSKEREAAIMAMMNADKLGRKNMKKKLKMQSNQNVESN